MRGPWVQQAVRPALTFPELCAECNLGGRQQRAVSAGAQQMSLGGGRRLRRGKEAFVGSSKTGFSGLVVSILSTTGATPANYCCAPSCVASLNVCVCVCVCLHVPVILPLFALQTRAPCWQPRLSLASVAVNSQPVCWGVRLPFHASGLQQCTNPFPAPFILPAALWLQTARYLLKAMVGVQKGQPAEGSAAYLNNTAAELRAKCGVQVCELWEWQRTFLTLLTFRPAAP